MRGPITSLHRSPSLPAPTLGISLRAAGWLLLAVGSLPAADLSLYTVTKGQACLQTNTGTPDLKPGSPYLFLAQAVPTGSMSVYNASITLPLHGSRGLFSTGPTSPLGLTDRAASQAALDATYGAGTYTFSFITAHDGVKNLPISLSGNAYPPAPHISNFAAAQAIDPSAPFLLTWDPFVGGTTNSLVQLRIENTSGQVFGTAARPGATNALNGTAQGLTIPAGTLAPGHSYLGHLLFETFTATNLTYTGAPGFAGYWRQTDFYLITAGPGAPTPPTIISIIPTNGATGVPVNTPLTATFSRPMGSGFSISVGGTTNASTSTWSADGRTLTITSTNHWPSNTTLNWLFNPSGTPPYIGDTQGDPLMADLPTAFTTGTQVLPSMPSSPSFTLPLSVTNGLIHLVLRGEPYRTYVWQSSSDLVNWSNLGTNLAATSQIEFFDTYLPGITTQFYRVLALR